MIRDIRYEQLTADIKKEIEQFRVEKGLDLDTAMKQWFQECFDQWMFETYGQDSSKRKHFRLNVEIPIKVLDTLIESSCDDPEAHTLVGKVVNISRGGLYFKYNNPIEISSIIKVLIDLQQVDPDLGEVEALAMIVRVDKLDSGYGIGVMFSSLQGTDRESLEIFILKNLAFHLYPGAKD